MITLGYKDKKSSLIRALIALLIGVLLLFFPDAGASKIIQVLIVALGVALVLFGGLMLFVLAGSISLVGGGPYSLVVAAIIVMGGILLLWSPFGAKLMCVLAGIFCLVYGINELLSIHRIGKATREYEIHHPKKSAGGSTQPDLGDVRDVDYRKVDDADEQ